MTSQTVSYVVVEVENFIESCGEILDFKQILCKHLLEQTKDYNLKKKKFKNFKSNTPQFASVEYFIRK